MADPSPTPIPAGKLMVRSVIGAVGCGSIGSIAGALINAAITGDTYVGLRIGGLLGAVIGGQLAAGTGLLGLGLMAVIFICSALGVGLAMAIARPDPAQMASMFPTVVGGVAGAFFGLGLAVWLARRWKRGPQLAGDAGGQAVHGSAGEKGRGGGGA
jgi:hypothetical protein